MYLSAYPNVLLLKSILIMRNYLSFLCLLLIGLVLSCGEDTDTITTFEGDVNLDSFVKVREFSDNGFTKINGNLTLGSRISRVNTTLSVNDELHSLDSVMGDLFILNTRGIRNLNIIKNLKFIGGKLEISGNRDLTSITELNDLEHLGKTIEISENQNLTSTEGLGGIQGHVQNITVSDNPVLEDIKGFNGIESTQFLILENNIKLRNFEGLENLKYILSGLTVNSNYELEDMSQLVSLQNNSNDDDSFSLIIESSPELASLKGLDQITHLSELNLDVLPKMNSLEGIEQLERVDNLTIRVLGRLESLNGFNKLNRIGAINIVNNSVLKDYCALSEAISNSGVLQQYIVENNLFNPTLNDFESGNCNN